MFCSPLAGLGALKSSTQAAVIGRLNEVEGDQPEDGRPEGGRRQSRRQSVIARWQGANAALLNVNDPVAKERRLSAAAPSQNSAVRLTVNEQG